MSDTKQTNPHERLKSSDVARLYKISRTTLWRLRKANKIQPVGSNGKDLLYLRADVERLQSSML